MQRWFYCNVTFRETFTAPTVTDLGCRGHGAADSSVNTEEGRGILLKHGMKGARETAGPEAVPGLAALEGFATGHTARN